MICQDDGRRLALEPTTWQIDCPRDLGGHVGVGVRDGDGGLRMEGGVDPDLDPRLPILSLEHCPGVKCIFWDL